MDTFEDNAVQGDADLGLAKLPIRHVRPNAFCVLCREALQLNRCYYTPNESWTADTLSSFKSYSYDVDGSRKDAGNCVVQLPLSGQDNWRTSRQTEHIRSQPCHDIWFCDDRGKCTGCSPEDTLDFAHLICLQLSQRYIEKAPGSILQGVSSYARPMFPFRLYRLLTGLRRRSTLPPAIGPELDQSTSLTGLVREIEKRLPLEIQKLVYDEVPDLFDSLRITSATAIEYARALEGQKDAPVTPQISFPLRGLPSTKKIGLNLTRILDQTYIKDIGTSSSTPFTQEISINGDVRGFQYSIGAYGIVAFRVVYEDSSCSPWLGDGKRMWTTMYEEADLTKLRVVSDGFKLIRLDTSREEDEIRGLACDKSTRFFIDHERIAPRGTKHLLHDINTPSPQILAHPEARLGRYAPIPRDGLVSLCMQFSRKGLTGIYVNDTRNISRDVATTTGATRLSVTHFFRPGEQIRAVHVVSRAYGAMYDGPKVLLQTSHDRTLFYGAYKALTTPNINLASFKIEETDQVTGFFFDPMNTDLMQVCSLGITLEPQAEQPIPVRPVYCRPAFDELDPEDYTPELSPEAYCSTANLFNVTRLNLMKAGKRCIGIKVERMNGVTEILGQWDMSNRDISILYDSRDGILGSLTFVYSSAVSKNRHVVDIIANGESRQDDMSFTWTRAESKLAWWFTLSNDMVQSWDGAETVLNMAYRGVYRDLVS